MPKSRRAKVAPLTKTKPKGRDHKGALIEKIRESLETYKHVYVFRVHNVRTNIIQAVRNDRREDSRLFMGSNKVMGVALGKDAATAVKPNLHKLTNLLSGLCGLLFTNLPKKQVKDYFASISDDVYARAGQPAAQDFAIPAGHLTRFPHSMLDQLRKLGLPVTLDKGIIDVQADTLVCKAGEPLSAEAAQLLKLFNLTTALFRFELVAHWTDGVARRVSEKSAKGGDE